MFLIHITIDRNAYGRQVRSFDVDMQVQGVQNLVHVSFIRAPIITSIGADVEVLAAVNNKPVIVKNKNTLDCTCHPELHGEEVVHEIFLGM